MRAGCRVYRILRGSEQETSAAMVLPLGKKHSGDRVCVYVAGGGGNKAATFRRGSYSGEGLSSRARNGHPGLEDGESAKKKENNHLGVMTHFQMWRMEKKALQWSWQTVRGPLSGTRTAERKTQKKNIVILENKRDRRRGESKHEKALREGAHTTKTPGGYRSESAGGKTWLETEGRRQRSKSESGPSQTGCQAAGEEGQGTGWKSGMKGRVSCRENRTEFLESLTFKRVSTRFKCLGNDDIINDIICTWR